MVDSKKISGLDPAPTLASDDMLVIVDVSENQGGDDSGDAGKTSRVTLSQVATAAKGDQGDQGDQGDPGPMPLHQWDGTSLRFQTPSGWGDYVDLGANSSSSSSSAMEVERGQVISMLVDEVQRLSKKVDELSK